MKLKHVAWIFLTTLLLTSLVHSKDKQKSKIEFVQITKPKDYAISGNILFVIDASSSINTSDEMKSKFNLAWKELSTKLISDDIYFAVYVFNDKTKNLKHRSWSTAFHSDQRYCNCLDDIEPNGNCDWWKAKKWVKSNTGVCSYGVDVLEKSFKEQNPLDKNNTNRLTIILITDGGFTEAAKAKNFAPIYDVIKQGQKWRIENDLSEASIMTVGLENTNCWSLNVKRPNNECQKFLKDIGVKYNGGYYLVRNKN